MFIRPTLNLTMGLLPKAVLTASLILLGSVFARPAYGQTAAGARGAGEALEYISLAPSGALSSELVSWDETTGVTAYSPVKITLDELLARLREHPTLESYSFSASADRLRAQSALALPDPVISLQLNNIPFVDPSFTEYLPTNKAVGVFQALPSRSERKAKSLKSLRQAAQSDVAAEESFARIKGRVFALIILRHSLNEQKSKIGQKLQKYEELKDIIDIEISSGRPLLYRLAQIDVERADSERELTTIDQDIGVINAELNNWVGFVPDVRLPEIRKIPLSGNAMQFHGVRVADAMVDISDAEVQKAEADFKPDWSVNFAYQQRESGANFDGDDWVSGGVGFTLPLWSGKRQTPNLQAAKSDRQAAVSKRTARARELRALWMQYEAKREAAAANIQILEQKITALMEQSDSQLVQYESGLGDYSPILDAEVAMLTLQIQILKEAARRDQMVVMMNSLMVTS